MILFFVTNQIPYIVANKVIKSKDGGFLLFDSTMEHFVTKNCSDGLRIVISMNFRVLKREEFAMIGENVEFKDYCDVTFTSKVVRIFSDKYEDVKFMDGGFYYWSKKS